MFSATQEQLISAAQQLMLRRGYAATGVHDICREAGVEEVALIAERKVQG